MSLIRIGINANTQFRLYTDIKIIPIVLYIFLSLASIFLAKIRNGSKC